MQASYTLRIGTRSSEMALFQARTVATRLEHCNPGLRCEVLPIETSGDRVLGKLSEYGGKGLFVRELDTALLEERTDLSVNCLKDIPNDLERSSGIRIGCVLRRDDVRDTLICRSAFSETDLEQHGGRIGTSSPRRRAILSRLYPQARIIDIRGNAGTRLRKLDAGDFDAIVLASAGLTRIGAQNRITRFYEHSEFLPAVGAGIISVDFAIGREQLAGVLESINDSETFFQMQVERALLNTLKGTCLTAVGAYTRISVGEVCVMAAVYSQDGKHEVVQTVRGNIQDEPSELGSRLGKALLVGGAASHI